jgi:hypothetical protein
LDLIEEVAASGEGPFHDIADYAGAYADLVMFLKLFRFLTFIYSGVVLMLTMLVFLPAAMKLL